MKVGLVHFHQTAKFRCEKPYVAKRTMWLSQAHQSWRWHNKTLSSVARLPEQQVPLLRPKTFIDG
jgi:hypothetical protein